MKRASIGIGSHRRLALSEKRLPYLLTLPSLLTIFGVLIIPILYSLFLSVHNLVLSSRTYEFVGLKHYIAMFSDKSFLNSIWQTLVFTVLSVAAEMVLGVGVALVLNQEFKGRAFVRAIFFLPVILSSGVLIGLETNTLMAGMQQMMAESSPFTLSESLMKILKLTGIGSDVLDIVFSLIDEVYDIVMASGIQIVVFLSGLQNVPRSLYEAADVEGCSKWEAFWTITFPMVSPLLIVNIIYTIIDFFMKTDSEVMKKINEEMTLKYNYGFSSAMAWVYFAITIVLIGASALMLKGVVSSDE